MIDEVAEVKQYLNGECLEDSRNHYRACYMISKYYKKLGMTRKEIFDTVSEWAAANHIRPVFSLISCVSAACENERELHSGPTVSFSQADVDCIRKYSRNREDRRAALALMCCAKCYADADGSFSASSSALASWLGMDAGNLQRRQIRHLCEFGFVEKLPPKETMKGWKKNFYRQAYRFRLLVPYDRSGPWELQHNDIRGLYERVFGEPYEKPHVNG